jgi:hypothetical protein
MRLTSQNLASGPEYYPDGPSNPVGGVFRHQATAQAGFNIDGILWVGAFQGRRKYKFCETKQLKWRVFNGSLAELSGQHAPRLGREDVKYRRVRQPSCATL